MKTGVFLVILLFLHNTNCQPIEESEDTDKTYSVEGRKSYCINRWFPLWFCKILPWDAKYTEASSKIDLESVEIEGGVNTSSNIATVAPSTSSKEFEEASTINIDFIENEETETEYVEKSSTTTVEDSDLVWVVSTAKAPNDQENEDNKSLFDINETEKDNITKQESNNSDTNFDKKEDIKNFFEFFKLSRTLPEEFGDEKDQEIDTE